MGQAADRREKQKLENREEEEEEEEEEEDGGQREIMPADYLPLHWKSIAV